MADINDRLDRLHRREQFDRRAGEPAAPAQPAGRVPASSVHPPARPGPPASARPAGVDDRLGEVLDAVAQVVRRHPGLSVMIALADGGAGRPVVRVTERDGGVETGVVVPGSPQPAPQGRHAAPAGDGHAFAGPDATGAAQDGAAADGSAADGSAADGAAADGSAADGAAVAGSAADGSAVAGPVAGEPRSGPPPRGSSWHGALWSADRATRHPAGAPTGPEQRAERVQSEPRGEHSGLRLVPDLEPSPAPAGPPTPPSDTSQVVSRLAQILRDDPTLASRWSREVPES